MGKSYLNHWVKALSSSDCGHKVLMVWKVSLKLMVDVKKELIVCYKVFHLRKCL